MLCLLVLPAVLLALSWRGTVRTKGEMSALAVVRFWVCGMLRFLSAAAVGIALAGLCAGDEVIGLPKKGVAVAFVFDVSHSMESSFDDMNDDMSRLDAAKLLATSLLQSLEQSPEATEAALIVCRGDGVALASPFTCDLEWVSDSISHLNAESTDASDVILAGGVKTAARSLPQASSAKLFVLLFTDKVQAQSDLKRQLDDAGRDGISTAAILLFDTESTAAKLKQTAWGEGVLALLAGDEGVGEQLTGFLELGGTDEPLRSAYKSQKRTFGSLLAIVAAWLFALSVFIDHLVVGNLRVQAALLLSCTLLVSGCSGKANNQAVRTFAAEWRIVQGRSFWQAGDHQMAAACFLEAAETVRQDGWHKDQHSAKQKGDEAVYSCALAGLGTSYLMLGQVDAAFEKYKEAWSGASDEVRFLILYNAGVALHDRGKLKAASDCFKKAVLLDSDSTSAKVNLELCLEETEKRERQDVQNAAWTGGDEGEFAQLLYSIVRGEEEGQWEAAIQDEH